MDNIFVTGNVVKLKSGNIVIISDSTEKYTNWISFNSERSSGGTQQKTKIVDEDCYYCGINDGGSPDEECEHCHGTGSYKQENPGMDQAVLLAPHVQRYIISCLLKNFDF